MVSEGDRMIRRKERIRLMRNLKVIFTVLIALFGSRLHAVEGDMTTGQLTRLAFEVEGRDGRVQLEADGVSYDLEFEVDRISSTAGALILKEGFEIRPDSLVTEWGVFSIGNLRVDSVYTQGKRVIGVVFKQRRSTTTSGRLSSRNRISVGERLIVQENDFVRGDAICFGADVRIRGEVNQNAVAVFGEVTIAHGGIVRGDVAAIKGSVEIESGSTVYGEIVSQQGTKRTSGRRSGRPGDDWGPNVFKPLFSYNRVDGLFLGAKLAFSDPDSLLPTVFASGGYAFMSEKWQHEVGVHQRIFEKYSFGLGGSFFRRTATDDEWIAPIFETTLLSVLAAEDNADYYEEKGGRMYITFDASSYNQVGVAYQFVRLDWLDHHPKLWSLFGSSKEFRANFSSVPAVERRSRLEEFDGKLGELTAWYRFDNSDADDFATRGWYGELIYSAAGDDLKGDLAYDRLTAEIRRYQPLTRRQALNVRMKYGIAGRELPLIRSFYLGGSRTIRGLDHKGIKGDQMLLGNLEYVIRFPRPKLETALLLDFGKTTGSEESIFSDGDFHSSIGLRVGITDAIKIDVAKSLDDSDESAKIWVLFQRSF